MTHSSQRNQQVSGHMHIDCVVYRYYLLLIPVHPSHIDHCSLSLSLTHTHPCPPYSCHGGYFVFSIHQQSTSTTTAAATREHISPLHAASQGRRSGPKLAILLLAFSTATTAAAVPATTTTAVVILSQYLCVFYCHTHSSATHSSDSWNSAATATTAASVCLLLSRATTADPRPAPAARDVWTRSNVPANGLRQRSADRPGCPHPSPSVAASATTRCILDRPAVESGPAVRVSAGNRNCWWSIRWL